MIVVNDKYAIGSDPLQWIIYVPTTPSKSNPNEWKPKWFYPSLEGAIAGLEAVLLRTSDYESFKDLETNARGIRRLMEKRFKTTI